MEKVELFKNIKKVIFNKPATIILFKDGDKSVAMCNDRDKYDPKTGFLVALVKKILPNKYNLCKMLENDGQDDIRFLHNYNYCSYYTIMNFGFNGCTSAVKQINDDYFSNTKTLIRLNKTNRILMCLLNCFGLGINAHGYEYLKNIIDIVSDKNISFEYPLTIDLKTFDYNTDIVHKNVYVNNVGISKMIKDEFDEYIANDKNLAQIMRDYNATTACGLDVRTMYPHSIKKVGENMSRGFEEGLNSHIKINYDMFEIDRSKGHIYNANIYETFLGRFNSTSKWTEDECLQHGLLGLMSELGELKEVLTEMFYTSDCSGDMFTHLHREMSDVCWMLCEYTSYSDFDLGPCPFSIHIENSIDFHNSNNTKYLNWYQPLPANNPFGVAINVVDTMMMDVSKICNIHQKILQGHVFSEFVDEHDDILFDIYVNLQYISQYIFDTNFTTLFDISMKKVKNRYPDGWMDPQRSINRKPEDI